VTIVTGFLTGSSAIICADSRETIADYAKSTTQKLRVTSYGNWRIGIAGSSDSAQYLDLFQGELELRLAPVRDFDYVKIVSIIKSTLHQLHKQHIWLRRWDRPSIQTLIALQGIIPTSSRALFVTQDSAVTPVSEYQSIGIGAYLANYLYERLSPSTGFTYNSPPDRMANLGVFILQQVKKSIQGCDGETTVAIFYGDGTFRYMTTDEVHEVESWMTRLDSILQPLWWHIANPSMNDSTFKGELERRFQKIESIRAAQSLSPHRIAMGNFLADQRQSIEDERNTLKTKASGE
jgi:hypothetical protein